MKSELIQLIDKNDVISFDIFDTLILRNILKPTDIFKILAIYAKEEFNIDDFYDIRIESEKNSRNEKNNFECSYDDIYNAINKKIKNKQYIERLKKRELELELEFCTYNSYMKSIFNYCEKRDKKIFLISDMYLEEDFINKLLKKNGYKNYKLFVSSAYKKNKGSKELFEYVYEKMHVEKSKWLHIGDNIYSDFNIPREFGINAYNYKNVTSNCNIEPKSIFESIILAIQCNYLYNGNKYDYWDIFGVKYISTIYFGFTKWLYDLTKDKDNLFFLARDGYVINELFQLFNNKDIFTRYIYCSRESLQIPSFIIDDEDDELIKFITENGGINYKMTLKDLLSRCNIDISTVSKSLIGAFGFKTVNDEISNDNYYDARKLVCIYLKKIKKSLIEKLDLAKEYLLQENMEQFSEINIVDIGWGGSIQSAISRIMQKKVNGYYFGTIDLKKKNSFTNMYGYYFDLDYPILNKKNIMDNVMMYELIFCAPHGTTKQYKKIDGIVKPVLNSNTHNNKFVKVFQKSAISIIKEYLKYYKYFDFLSKNFCVNPYLNFIEEKHYNDVIHFEKLSNDILAGLDKNFKYVEKFDYDDFKSKITIKNKLYNLKNCLWNGAFYSDKPSFFLKKHIKNLCLVNLHDDSDFVKLLVKYSNDNKICDCFYMPYYICNDNYSFAFDFPNNVKELKIILSDKKMVKLRGLIINTNKGNASVKIRNRNLLKDKIEGCIFIKCDKPTIEIVGPEGFTNIEFSANIQFL